MNEVLKGLILGLVLALSCWWLPTISNRLYQTHQTLINIEKLLKDKQ